MVNNPEEYQFGGLWFIRHSNYTLVEAPDLLIREQLPEFFSQKLITEIQ